MIAPSTAARHGPAETSVALRGPALHAARSAWVMLAGCGLWMLIAGTPALFRQILQVCPGTTCNSGQVSPAEAEALSSLGLCLPAHAAYLSGLALAVGVAYCAVALIIFARRSREWVALTAALWLVTFLLSPMGASCPVGRGGCTCVFSTLGLAAPFNPLRRRLQAAIDRRFCRRKYDAARTLAAFGAAARDEPDLGRLTGRLVEVVEETMQPERVSLWLRPGRDGSRRLDSVHG